MKRPIIISFMMIQSALLHANSLIAPDPIMGANFVRTIECTAKITNGEHPKDATLLIIGKYLNEYRPSIVLATSKDELRFAVRLNSLPNPEERLFHSEIIAHDIDSNNDFSMGQIDIDLSTRKGILNSSSEPYVLGSFELFNCKML